MMRGLLALLGALALVGALALFAGVILTGTLSASDGLLMLSLLVFVVIVQLYDIGAMLAKRNEGERGESDEKRK